MSSSVPLQPLQPLRIERVVTYLRIFGVVAGVPMLLVAEFPSRPYLQLAWGIHVVLVVGTIALAVWRRHSRPGDDMAVLAAGFVLDSLVIGGYVLAFTYVEPNVGWAMIFTLLADAALRFGVRGAVVGWVLSALLYVLQVRLHEATTGIQTPLVSYFFVLGTLVGAAGILAVFTVTLQRQARIAQQQALALADASRVRERLLAMSSHEFRGSLAAMVLAADTVRANLTRIGPDRAAALLSEVDRHGRNLRRLVDDLFAVARASSEAIQIRHSWDNLPASVEVALAAAARHRAGHHLTVSVEPVACELDHERFQQVVRNLVENAYKYAPADSRVTVTATHRGGCLELRVADTGPGIPASERERVFEPFHRRRDAAERGDSAGLGLYVVQQIVSAMGGSLDLHTSSGGTEFVVRVPARVSTELRSVKDAPESDPATGSGRERSGRHGAVGH